MNGIISYKEKDSRFYYVNQENRIAIFDLEYPQEEISFCCNHEVYKFVLHDKFTVALDFNNQLWLLEYENKTRNKLLAEDIVDIACIDDLCVLLHINRSISSIDSEYNLKHIDTKNFECVKLFINNRTIYVSDNDNDCLKVINPCETRHIFNIDQKQYIGNKSVHLDSDNILTIEESFHTTKLPNVKNYLIDHERKYIEIITHDGEAFSRHSVYGYSNASLLKIKNTKNVVDLILMKNFVVYLENNGKIKILDRRDDILSHCDSDHVDSTSMIIRLASNNHNIKNASKI